MPRYYFNVRNHVHTEDHDGVDLPDLATAKREALKDVADIVKTSSGVIANRWSGWSIEVCDGARKVLLVVPFRSN